MGIRIQFLGLVGSGKSFLSQELAKTLDGHVLPFAKKVYELATLVKGAPINKTLSKDRELLKLIGTTWGRESKRLPCVIQDTLELYKPQQWGSPNIWAEIFIKECQSLPKHASIFNDDTRFENELKIAGELGGFIPIYVACTEAARLARLFGRGDEKDPNDPNHQSEALVNKLHFAVLKKNLMTVIWNDDSASKPDQPWIFNLNEFKDLASVNNENRQLSKALDWDILKLRHLLSFVKNGSIVSRTNKISSNPQIQYASYNKR